MTSWKKVFLDIMELRPKENEIYVEGVLFYFKPVILDLHSRLGYMVIWEDKSKRATQLSRFVVPNYLKAITIDDIEMQIPSDLELEPMYPL